MFFLRRDTKTCEFVLQKRLHKNIENAAGRTARGGMRRGDKKGRKIREIGGVRNRREKNTKKTAQTLRKPGIKPKQPVKNKTKNENFQSARIRLRKITYTFALNRQKIRNTFVQKEERGADFKNSLEIGGVVPYTESREVPPRRKTVRQIGKFVWNFDIFPHLSIENAAVE